MGTTDAILDLVSSGTTLRENNLKEIEGGVVLESQVSFHITCNVVKTVTSRIKQGEIVFPMWPLRLSFHVLQAVLVASRRSLNMRKGALEITHEMLERLEAHLRAIGVVTVCQKHCCRYHYLSYPLCTS